MSKLNYRSAKLERVLYEADCAEFVAEVALEIQEAAKAVFLEQRVLPWHNEYLASFSLVKHGKSYYVRNKDKRAFWVEFGAHAGGKTPVLGYAPLRRGMDIIASNFI